MMKRTSFLGLLVLTALFVSDTSQASTFNDFSNAIKNFNDDGMDNAIVDLYAEATANPIDFRAQWEAAEASRLHGSQLRETRLIMEKGPGEKPKDLFKRLMDKQLSLAKLGQAYAERALELASGDSDVARANRVLGELYSLQITGMVSGMRKGPKAKSNIKKSLVLTPDDPESLRAIGIMYLHNPPISGGDVPKAIATFTTCISHAESSAQYRLLLAMAYQKKGSRDEAREQAEQAAKLNPKNKNVQRFIETLEQTKD